MERFILAINTATAPFSTALVREDGALIAEVLLTSPSRGFGLFMPTLHQMLSSVKVELRDLKALAVARGPGSFTGLRVGLAAAKGICMGLGIPAVAVSSLEALAAQCQAVSYPICALIDSRQGEFFTAFFRALPGGGVMLVQEETCLDIQGVAGILEEQTFFVGNDYPRQATLLRKALGEKALLAPAGLWNLRASAVAMQGLCRVEQHGFDDLKSLVPFYIRPPDIRTDGARHKAQGARQKHNKNDTP
jgi:tRNA threonylcarbamoyladenosine biosynthesis protein TsaB